MARRRTARQRKRFEATSISTLLPGTLNKKKGTARNRGQRQAPRKRSKPNLWSKVSARWGFSHYVAMLLAIAGLLALFLLFTDPRFTIEQPAVAGNQYLDPAEVIRKSGLDQSNIFLIHADEIARRLSLIPQVKEAHLRLGLPNRAMISIVEREPILNYVREGETFWVDEEGHVFPANEFRLDLPVLLDDDDSASLDGSHLPPALTQAIAFLHVSLPEMNEFRYRNDYGLYFITPEGWRVMLGDSEGMEQKLSLWQSVRQQLLQDDRPIQSVDLRFGKVYVTR